MLRINKILFPTDFSSCAEHAFSHAAYLADRFGADLHILHATVQRREEDDAPAFDVSLGEAEILEELHMATQAWKQQRETQDTQVIQAHVQDASVPGGILAYAKRHAVDLIVMGTHGRRGIDRLLMGSVAEEVVRLAACPVFTVREAEDRGPGPMIRRILVPVDFSDYAHLSLTYAKELAAAYGARLDLVHVIEEAILPHVYGMEPVAVSVPEVQTRTQQALREMIEAANGAAAPGDIHVLLGNPALEIVDFAARNGNDLIVIATHGRTGLKRFLMGSISEKVVRMAPCPVFTVKSFAKTGAAPPGATAATEKG